ncbi:MAG TPA: hypothetical protein VKQ30_25885 [Ktedonobacterales bacterium]|nr:hypothetical protein [Ktedonobacterales bacterium]
MHSSSVLTRCSVALFVALLVQFTACTSSAEADTAPPPPTKHATALAVSETILAPASDQSLFCLPDNPGCAKITQPWWALRNENQPRDLVGFAFAPGLISERRFAEAVVLLYQVPEGRDLITQAAAQHIHVIGVAASDLADGVADPVAAYFPAQHLVAIAEPNASLSIVILADFLSHEFRHVADFAAGVDTDDSYPACIDREVRARQTEQRYLADLVVRFGKWPSPGRVGDQLGQTDQSFFASLRYLAADSPAQLYRDTVDDYGLGCSQHGG